MSTILFLSYLLSIIGSTSLILFVYQKRNVSTSIRAFVLFALFTTLWQLASFVSELTTSSPELSRLSTNFGIAVGTFMALYFYIFCKTFSNNNRKWSNIDSTLLLVSLLFCGLAFTDKIIRLSGNSELVYGPGYTTNTVYIILLFLLGTFYLVRKSINDNASRGQIKYLFIGIAVALSTNLLTGFLLIDSPMQKYIAWLSPLSILLMVLFFMIAILRHKLFDIRPIVARTVSYVMISSFVALFYVGFAFIIKKIVSPDLEISVAQSASNIVLTTVLVLLFPTVKTGFDRLTKRIFFRDSYDPQAFLGQLNKNLVNVVEVNRLLRQSAEIIELNLKSEFCNFYLPSTQYISQRSIGGMSLKIMPEEIEVINKYFSKKTQKIISTDELADQTDMADLYKILTDNEIGMIIRLSGNTLVKEYHALGYAILGYKKSGNIYNNQDVKIMDIITNEISIAVENALRFEEIEQFNVTLQNKIDQATSQLKRTNKKLQTLDEAKDEFISMASHQLRTPLTSIKGYLSMVLEGDVGPVPDQQKEMLTTAFTSAQRMVYLIADLLNVSRLQTGKFVIEPSECYLPDLITDELAQLREALIAKNINVVYDQPANFPKLKLDETKIRQVMMNFIDNSLYYTPEGGTVTIALLNKPKEIEFSVNDTGIGVPRSEQHKLFTKFYRAGNARKARPDGTGLGLFMAKKVIIASGGAVVFKSTEGKGSTFGFTFPKK